MKFRGIFALSVLLTATQITAAELVSGPVIEGYGASYVIEDADVPLATDHIYKVVWEITDYAGEPDGINRSLDRVARFLNLHAANGLAPEDMQLGVVVHGRALISMLSDSSYQARFDQANPNLELLEALSAAGVEFFVCGQSMARRDFAKSELAGPVKLATSALTMVHQLQFEGYTLQP